MSVLLDTNILLRLGASGVPSHSLAKQAVASLLAEARTLVLVPQVLYEYWVVATRPVANNGFGSSPNEADSDIADWCSMFRLLRDERGIFERWRTIVANTGVIGKTAHDARIVAAMQRHRVDCLLTFNKPDFSRFANIHVHTLDEVVSGAKFPT